ncbi:hypothetical protein N7474_006667 [Penicillium riverlandense]|uniref:uncharacterized protein n=1 Tax=Penicillium riverlandense TaxID=1903569 RepID=UPI0025498CAC|nr:uncharacterized protein N7474_006667 [Penicillium riverlandense]KAJ5814890.1 hypothetical protein N7474_006667 [Penicillium riverlandense]
MDKNEPDDFVTVRCSLPTLPLPSISERPTLTTARLLIRPNQPTDLEALYVLRTQPEVMKWTTAGCIDKDIERTRELMNGFLPPNDTATLNYAICLKSTGELIGQGGCHVYRAKHGWPEVGYMFRKEFWGQGFATEFLGAWLQYWGGLPRTEQEVRVEKAMVTGEGRVPEQVIALIEPSNGGSQKVLLRSGFEPFREFTEVDEFSPDGCKLVAFRFFPSK